MEMLMLLNKFSGRSFNDLSQYPILPWVLSDYKCDPLTLRSQWQQLNCFRNLHLHTGILSEDKKNKAA
jgi:hypothetical protein